MTVKKKTTKTATATAQAAHVPLEEESEKETKRPPVTQVVEVVEEVPEEKTEIPQKKEMLEEPVEASAPTFATTSDESEEKKRELVDELFQKNDEDTTTEVMPEISMHTKSSKNSLYLWAIGVVSACIVIGGLLLFSSKKSHFLSSINLRPSPTATPTPKATATPTPEAKRDAIAIQVLNGGGKAGAATKMKKFLEDKGYKVTDTGNAQAYTYDKTEILVKPDKSAYLTLLTNDLKDSYSLGTTAATLEDSVSYDARVIVGKE